MSLPGLSSYKMNQDRSSRDSSADSGQSQRRTISMTPHRQSSSVFIGISPDTEIANKFARFFDPRSDDFVGLQNVTKGDRGLTNTEIMVKRLLQKQVEASGKPLYSDLMSEDPGADTKEISDFKAKFESILLARANDTPAPTGLLRGVARNKPKGSLHWGDVDLKFRPSDLPEPPAGTFSLNRKPITSFITRSSVGKESVGKEGLKSIDVHFPSDAFTCTAQDGTVTSVVPTRAFANSLGEQFSCLAYLCKDDLDEFAKGNLSSQAAKQSISDLVKAFVKRDLHVLTSDQEFEPPGEDLTQFQTGDCTWHHYLPGTPTCHLSFTVNPMS